MDDSDFMPFNKKGGAVRVYQLFGDELKFDNGGFNEVLTA